MFNLHVPLFNVINRLYEVVVLSIKVRGKTHVNGWSILFSSMRKQNESITKHQKLHVKDPYIFQSEDANSPSFLPYTNPNQEVINAWWHCSCWKEKDRRGWKGTDALLNLEWKRPGSICRLEEDTKMEGNCMKRRVKSLSCREEIFGVGRENDVVGETLDRIKCVPSFSKIKDTIGRDFEIPFSHLANFFARFPQD